MSPIPDTAMPENLTDFQRIVLDRFAKINDNMTMSPGEFFGICVAPIILVILTTIGACHNSAKIKKGAKQTWNKWFPKKTETENKDEENPVAENETQEDVEKQGNVDQKEAGEKPAADDENKEGHEETQTTLGALSRTLCYLFLCRAHPTESEQKTEPAEVMTSQ